MHTPILTLEKSNCVALGSFNIYIIEPRWLIEEKILSGEQPISVEFDVKEPGLRLTSHQDAVSWEVRPSRLVIETRDPSVDCGSLMAKVLKKLSHTPVSALGKNFSFKLGGPDKVVSKLFPRDREAVVPGGFSLVAQARAWSLDQGDHRFNLTMFKDRAAVMLAANVHCSLDGKSAKAKTRQAIYSAGLCATHLKSIKTLTRRMLGLEIAL